MSSSASCWNKTTKYGQNTQEQTVGNVASGLLVKKWQDDETCWRETEWIRTRTEPSVPSCESVLSPVLCSELDVGVLSSSVFWEHHWRLSHGLKQTQNTFYWVPFNTIYLRKCVYYSNRHVCLMFNKVLTKTLFIYFSLIQTWCKR